MSNITAIAVYDSLVKNTAVYRNLEYFVESAEKYNAGECQQDIILEYIKLSKGYQEILNLIKSLQGNDSKKEIATIFRVLTCFLIRSVSDVQLQATLGSAVVNELLIHGLRAIKEMVKAYQKQSHIETTLRLLASMVVQGPNLAESVYSKLNFSGMNFIHLLSKTDIYQEDDIRSMFINVIVLFMSYGNHNLILQMVEAKGFLNAIFPGLVADKADTILLVLDTFLSKIVRSGAFSKTTKTLLFNDFSLRFVFKLYSWVGPMKIIEKKTKKRKLGEHEEGDTRLVEAGEDEVRSVKESAHSFMTALCCSYKHGIICRDLTFGSSSKNQNQILTNVLKAFSNPHLNSLAADFVIDVMKICPDQIKFFLPFLKQSLEPRLSVPWLQAVSMFKKVILGQDPVLGLFRCKEIRTVNKNLICANVLCGLDIISFTKFAEPLKEGHIIIVDHLLDLICATMEKILVVQKYCVAPTDTVFYSEADLKEFLTAFITYASGVMPNLKLIKNQFCNFACEESSFEVALDLKGEMRSKGFKVPNVESYISKFLDVLVYYRKLFCVSSSHDELEFLDVILVSQKRLEFCQSEKILCQYKLIELAICDKCIKLAFENKNPSPSLTFVLEMYVNTDNKDVMSRISSVLAEAFSFVFGAKVSNEKFNLWLQTLKGDSKLNLDAQKNLLYEAVCRLQENSSTIMWDGNEFNASSIETPKTEIACNKLKRRLNKLKLIDQIVPVALLFQTKLNPNDICSLIMRQSQFSLNLVNNLLKKTAHKEEICKAVTMLLSEHSKNVWKFIVPVITMCLEGLRMPEEGDFVFLQSCAKFLAMNLNKMLFSSNFSVDKKNSSDNIDEELLNSEILYLMKKQSEICLELLYFLIDDHAVHKSMCSYVTSLLNRDQQELDSVILTNTVLKCLSVPCNLDGLFLEAASAFLLKRVKGILLENAPNGIENMCDFGHAMKCLTEKGFLSEKKMKKKIFRKLLDLSKEKVLDSSVVPIFEQLAKCIKGKSDAIEELVFQIAINWLMLMLQSINSYENYNHHIMLITNVFEETMNSSKEKVLFETPNWEAFIQRIIKVALRNSNDGADLVKIFCILCNERYLAFPSEKVDKIKVEEVTKLYMLLTSHSNFFNILLEDDEKNRRLKERVLELMVILAKYSSDVCKEVHIPLFLAAYSATLELSDQYLLYLIKLYEESGVDMAAFRPFIWGKSAIAHYSVKKFSVSCLWNRPQLPEVLRLFHSDDLDNTALHFPLNLGMEIEPVCLENELGSSTCNTVYDPRFALMMLAGLLSPGSYVNCISFIESNVLSVIFASLSSFDSNIRSLGYYCLSQFYSHMEGSSFKPQEIWLPFLDSVRNSTDTPNMRLSCIVTLFLARAVKVLLNPGDNMYIIIYRFLTLKPALDTVQVPEFYKLFNSTELDYRTHRNFILTLLEDGLRTSLDYHLCKKRFLFTILLPFFNSAISSKQEKLKVLGIISSAMKIFSSAKLLYQSGLLAWIHSAVEACDHTEVEILSGFSHIMDSLWKCTSCVFKKDTVNDDKPVELACGETDNQKAKEKFLHSSFPNEFLLVQRSLLSKIKMIDVQSSQVAVKTFLDVFHVVSDANKNFCKC